MEYPEIPITQDTWSNIIKKGISGQLDSTAKYIDIQNGEKASQKSGKGRKNSSKTKSKSKRDETKSADFIKRKKTDKKKQKSTKRPRMLKAPANFI